MSPSGWSLHEKEKGGVGNILIRNPAFKHVINQGREKASVRTAGRKLM